MSTKPVKWDESLRGLQYELESHIMETMVFHLAEHRGGKVRINGMSELEVPADRLFGIVYEPGRIAINTGLRDRLRKPIVYVGKEHAIIEFRDSEQKELYESGLPVPLAHPE